MATPRKKPIKKPVVVKKSVAKKAPVKKSVVKKSVAKPRLTPTSDLAARSVAEFPRTRKGPAPTTKYQDKLAEIRAMKVKERLFVPVAEFASVGGASCVKKNLTRGLMMCDGEVTDWEFVASRRSTNTDEGIGSILYAKLVKE